MTTADTTTRDDLEARLLAAVTGDASADLELVAHEVATSDDAQTYLVALVGTLGALSGASEPAARAQALLEHGLAIAAEHAEAGAAAAEAVASAAHAAGASADRGDKRTR